MSFNFKYEYYDSPEGKDVALKTFALSKYAAVSGLALGTFDVLMYSHPQGLFNTAGRYLYFTGPLIGMATAFAVTTNVAQNIRGKNDALNYFLGGAMAGSVFGLWQKSMTLGVPAAFVLGCLAIAKKTAVDDGWKMFPDVKHATQNVNSAKRDWSILPDLPKNFKTGP